MTGDQLAQLRAVNGEINAIPYAALPAPDEPTDWWTDVPIAGRSWVCRDYVLVKADKLRQLGWPASALAVVLCWTEPVGNPPQREYHAVLAAQPDGESEAAILDSRFDDVYPLSRPLADYRWDRRQIAGTTEFATVA